MSHTSTDQTLDIRIQTTKQSSKVEQRKWTSGKNVFEEECMQAVAPCIYSMTNIMEV